MMDLAGRVQEGAWQDRPLDREAGLLPGATGGAGGKPGLGAGRGTEC